MSAFSSIFYQRRKEPRIGQYALHFTAQQSNLWLGFTPIIYVYMLYIQPRGDFNWLCVVNTLLHNSFSNKYLSRYSSDFLDYQCQHTATIPWLINVSTRTRSTRLQSRDLSMSQLEHDPHSYNPVVLINVSTRTRSTRLQARALSRVTQGWEVFRFYRVGECLQYKGLGSVQSIELGSVYSWNVFRLQGWGVFRLQGWEVFRVQGWAVFTVYRVWQCLEYIGLGSVQSIQGWEVFSVQGLAVFRLYRVGQCLEYLGLGIVQSIQGWEVF